MKTTKLTASTETKTPKYKHVLAASNLRKELKNNFPGIKFAVRSEAYSGGSSITVAWEMGPTVAQVKELANRYKVGSFCGLDDSYDFRNDNREFTETYGGVYYVFCERSIPEVLQVFVAKEVASIAGLDFTGMGMRIENKQGQSDSIRQFVRELFYDVSFPAGVEGATRIAVLGNSIYALELYI